MSIFTIETETSNIAVHATAKDAKRVARAEVFQTEAALAKLAAKWPSNRLVEILNGLSGEKPVKKVTDRKKAVARIWKAIQSLLGAPATAAIPATVANAAPVASKPGKKARGAGKASQGAHNANVGRTGTKTQAVLALLRRAGGVGAQELMKATGWQPHSVRGFLSGTVGKKMGLTVVSVKGPDGDRNYSIEA